ncbi:hypothetical protein NDU88_003865 [Pleurodeles waltl]|uniref:Uncharacterized protein n=1 Tax=Pleurodeles waltl TaxID=8319 RepID=A0AAV7W6H1_PLEWA|nr:hypothetical protein NDU88_003865 [Pleurodeles waltl]
MHPSERMLLPVLGTRARLERVSRLVLPLAIFETCTRLERARSLEDTPSTSVFSRPHRSCRTSPFPRRSAKVTGRHLPGRLTPPKITAVSAPMSLHCTGTTAATVQCFSVTAPHSTKIGRQSITRQAR